MYLSSQHTILGLQNHGIEMLEGALKVSPSYFIFLLDNVTKKYYFSKNSPWSTVFYRYGDRSTGRVKDLPRDAWPVRGSSTAESQASWFSVWGFLFCLFYFIHVQLMSHTFLCGGEILVFQECNHGYKGWDWNHFTFNTNNSNRFSLSFMYTLLHPPSLRFPWGQGSEPAISQVHRTTKYQNARQAANLQGACTWHSWQSPGSAKVQAPAAPMDWLMDPVVRWVFASYSTNLIVGTS